MFSYLTQYLSRLDSQPVRTVVFTAVGILVLSVILASVIGWLRRRGQDGAERWPALVTGSIGAVLKVLIGLAILAGMALHLSFQSHEFARLRGGITQRSYEAVKTIWGRPHTQRELRGRNLPGIAGRDFNRRLMWGSSRLQAAGFPTPS